MNEPTNPKPKKLFPSRRATVFIPTAIFVPIDVLLLNSTGRSGLSVVLYALATTPLIAWWLNRNYERRFTTYKRKNPDLFPNDPAAVMPPSGSWANPSRRQKVQELFIRRRRYRR